MTGEDLKKAVLQAAVQGKLSERCKTDTPAAKLLRDIRAKRAELAAAKQIKLPKEGESIIYRDERGEHWERRIDKKGKAVSDSRIEDEMPFEIPAEWQWARLGSIATFGGGGTPDKSERSYWGGDIPWASMKDIHGEILHSTIDTITEEGFRSKASISVCEPGDLIVSTRLNPGKSIISGIRTTINQDLKAVWPLGIEVPYLHCWFKANLSEFMKLGSGTTVPGIKLQHLENALIPVPPIEEQERIVAKLDEVMPLIEEYGRLQEQRDKLDAELPEKLRKAVLRAGMQGALVGQASAVEDPLAAIEKQLQKEGRARNKITRKGNCWLEDDGARALDITAQIPFDIPDSWMWMRMESVITFINGRAYKKDELLQKGKYPVLRVGNFFTNDSWYYSDLELEETKYCNSGDLLYAWSASFGPKVWTGEKCIFHYHIWKLSFSQCLNRDFLYWFLEDDVARARLATTGSAMVHVSMANMKPRFVAIPPLEEQERIVAKLAEAMPLIDGLRR